MRRKDGVKGTHVRKQMKAKKKKPRKWRSPIQEEKGEQNGKQ